MPSPSPKVDKAIGRADQWLDGFGVLRELLLATELEEGLKWGWPCYMLNGKNVVLIHGFKEYFALLFFKGSLLTDRDGLLVAPGSMQAARQFQFAHNADTLAMRDSILAFVREAIEVERAGLKPTMKETAEFEVPEEFQVRLDEMPELEAAFESLTPGRQRQYLRHFADAKQSTTRAARVEKHLPRILDGKGMND